MTPVTTCPAAAGLLGGSLTAGKGKVIFVILKSPTGIEATDGYLFEVKQIGW